MFPDTTIRHHDRCANPVAIEREVGNDTKRPGQTVGVEAATNESRHDINRHAGRNFAGILTTHAIGNYVEAELVIKKEAVFIDIAAPAEVAFTVAFNETHDSEVLVSSECGESIVPSL